MPLLVSIQEKMGDFRVFFVNSYSANARRVICEVNVIN